MSDGKMLYERQGIAWREGAHEWYVKFNHIWLSEYEAPIEAFKSGNIVTVRVFDEPAGQPEGHLMAKWVIE